MTQPYRVVDVNIQTWEPPDESVLVVRTSWRIGDVQTPRGLRTRYAPRHRTPFADDLVVSLYRLHRLERTV